MTEVNPQITDIVRPEDSAVESKEAEDSEAQEAPLGAGDEEPEAAE